jgi:hypothetical protein
MTNIIPENGNGSKPVAHTNGFTPDDAGQPEKLRAPYILTPDPLAHQASEVKRPEPKQPAKKERHFKPFTLADLIARPPKQWLITGLFGRGDMGMIFGPPGSGKTFVTADMIVAACLGKPFAGQFSTARPLNIAYCASEGLDGLPQRFAAAAAHHGMADDCLNFTFFEIVPQLFDGNSPDSIALFVAEWREAEEAGQVGPLDLLFIDTQHGATVGADENSSTHMGLCLHAAKAAIKALGCTVALNHHSNRAGTGERGSSSMRGAMDFMIETKEVVRGEKFTMQCAKLKDGRAWEAQGFTLVPVPGFAAPRVEWTGTVAKGNDEHKGDARKSDTGRKVLQVLGSDESRMFTRLEIGEEIDSTPQNVGNVADRLIREGYITQVQNERKILAYIITAAGKEALQDVDKPI